MNELIKEYGGADLLDLVAVEQFGKFCYNKAIDEVLKKISEVIPFLNNAQLTAYFNICDKICELKEQNK